MKLSLKITPKLTLVFVLFAIVVLVGVSLFAYYSGRFALEAAIVSDLHSTAIEKQAALEAWVEEGKSDIDMIASYHHLQETISTLMASSPNSATARAAHDHLVTTLKRWVGKSRGFLDLFVLAPESGRVIAATDSHEEGKFEEDRLYFINGKKSPYVQNPYYKLSTQVPTMTAAAPIVSAEGRLLAVLAGRLNLNALNEIITRRTGIHQTSDAFLVNTSHLFVTQPRFVPDPAVLKRGIYTEAVNRGLAGNSGATSTKDYRGVPSIIVYRWLPERQLCLIVKMEQAEAYASIWAFRNTLILIGGVALLLASAIAFGLARTITRPILTLQTGVERFGKGELDSRLPETSIDEIGLLAKEFNNMAANLAEKESKLHAYAVQLEQMVESRTAELQRSEERFRLAAESSTDLIYEWDIKERVEWFGKIDELLGYAPSEFPRTLEAWANSVYPDDRDRVMAAVKNHLEKNEPYDIEYRVSKKDGTYNYWWALGMAVRDEKGNPYRWIGSVTDVTERKRAETSIRRLATVVRDSNDAIMVQDFEGRIIAWNRGAELMYGYREDEALQMSIWRLIPAGKRTEQEQIVRRVKEGKEATSFETKRLTKEGRLLDVWMTVTKLLDDAGTAVGIACTERDITERKRAEEEVRTLNAELEQRVVERTAELEAANKELEAFSYSVSHDLRAPLRAIDGFSRIVLEGYFDKLDEEGKRFLNIIRSNILKMDQLISDLLALSRFGRQELKMSEIDMGKLAETVFGELKATAPDRRLQLNVKALQPARSDRTMIRQVFINLLSNAIKFTRPREIARIEVGGRSEGDENIYYVRDNGVGFDMQYIDKLFGVFQRLHSSEEFEGTGIGLAIAQRIIHRHGGRVWAEGKVGEGAIFYFSLPAK